MTLQYHGNLFERSVARTLAYAVYRDLHLARSAQHSAKGVGRGHAEVVVAMGGYDGTVYAVYVLLEILYLVAIFRRQAVARGVGNVDHRGSGLYHGLNHSGEILVFGAPCILGIELHVLHILLGILHSGHSTLYYLLAVAVKLVFDVRVACAYTRVYALVLGILQSLCSHVYVFFHRTCECADGGPRHGL